MVNAENYTPYFTKLFIYLINYLSIMSTIFIYQIIKQIIYSL